MTDPHAVLVRTATPDDAELVRTLVGEIAAHQNQAADVTVTVARWRELLGRPDVTVLLAERDHEPAGYVSAVRRLHLWSGKDVIALDDLYVRAAHRGLGIGRTLMTELARRAEAERLTITWGVQPGNTDAQRFYERLGATLRPKIIAAWTPHAAAAPTPADAG